MHKSFLIQCTLNLKNSWKGRKTRCIGLRTRFVNKKEKTLLESTKTVNFSDKYKKSVRYSGNNDIITRSNRFLKKLQANREKNEQKKLEQEMNPGFSFRPQINESSGIKRNIQDLYKWKREVDEKRRSKQDEVEKKAYETVSCKDKKAKGSKVILKDRFIQLKRERPVVNKKTDKEVCDRLNSYKWAYERKRKEKEEEMYSSLFKPDLSVTENGYWSKKREIKNNRKEKLVYRNKEQIKPIMNSREESENIFIVDLKTTEENEIKSIETENKQYAQFAEESQIKETNNASLVSFGSNGREDENMSCDKEEEQLSNEKEEDSIAMSTEDIRKHILSQLG